MSARSGTGLVSCVCPSTTIMNSAIQSAVVVWMFVVLVGGAVGSDLAREGDVRLDFAVGEHHGEAKVAQFEREYELILAEGEQFAKVDTGERCGLAFTVEDGTVVTIDEKPSNKLAVEQTAREKAFRRILVGGTARGDFTVGSYNLLPASSTPACAFRTLITAFGGSRTLTQVTTGKVDRFELRQRVRVSKQDVASIAAKVIELVERVHELGMVHGDIVGGNFVWSGDDICALTHSLRIIDFGRASPYLTATGDHIPDLSDEGHKDWEYFGLQPLILSPFELETPKRKLSRRDDMFRVSELLMDILGVRLGAAGDEAAGIAAAKRTRMTPGGINQVFNEFHMEMGKLKFDEAPDYRRWISRFVSAASESSRGFFSCLRVPRRK